MLAPRLGAQARNENAVRAHTRRRQLIAVRGGKVQMQPISRAGCKPPLDGRLIRPSILERLDYLGTDFAAAGSEARADGSDEIVGLAGECTRHCLHPLFCGARRGAPPARVDGARRARSRIGHQDWRAIRDTDADGHVRIVGNDDVRGRSMPDRIVAAARDGDARAVHLPDKEQARRWDIEERRDRGPFAVILSQLQVRAGEEMSRRDSLAPQHTAERRLRP